MGQDLRLRVILGHNENDYHIQSDVIVFIAAVFELWGAIDHCFDSNTSTIGLTHGARETGFFREYVGHNEVFS